MHRVVLTAIAVIALPIALACTGGEGLPSVDESAPATTAATEPAAAASKPAPAGQVCCMYGDPDGPMADYVSYRFKTESECSGGDHPGKAIDDATECHNEIEPICCGHTRGPGDDGPIVSYKSGVPRFECDGAAMSEYDQARCDAFASTSICCRYQDDEIGKEVLQDFGAGDCYAKGGDWAPMDACQAYFDAAMAGEGAADAPASSPVVTPPSPTPRVGDGSPRKATGRPAPSTRVAPAKKGPRVPNR